MGIAVRDKLGNIKLHALNDEGPVKQEWKT